LTAVSAVFSSAALDVPFTAATPRHEPTTDLIGRRVEYAYSPTERYEHIYLNKDFYTWHCLMGSEKGLADTDRCHYLKLGDELYLFVWREKIVPTLGAVVADFSVMRTMGKIFGHAQDGPAGVVDFPVGARARLLNMTSHGEAIGS
jgi:MoaF C-terminal domain